MTGGCFGLVCSADSNILTEIIFNINKYKKINEIYC